jgi:hypothetical protein
MFKKLLSDNRIFGAIVCVLVFIVGGLLYVQFVQRQASRDIQRTQDILEQRDTSQTGKAEPQTETGGHWHDDKWYAEPHNPPAQPQQVEPGPPPIIESAEVIGTPVGAQPIDAQTGAQGKPESSQRTPESREAYNKWVAWEDKHSKLRKEYGQASQEMLDAMPGTEKDAKRYIADENYKREVQRKMQEAMDKSAEILGRMREYEAKRIFPPGTPTQ